MDLPLAEEIREARRLAEEGAAAWGQMQQIQVILLALDVLLKEPAALEVDDLEIPGGALVDEICERWEQLADLTAVGPRPTQSVRERLRMRRQQLEAARQLLTPLSREAHQRSDRLAELQAEQRHLLEDPRYADDVAELTVMGNDRVEVQMRLSPLASRAGGLKATVSIAGTFLERIEFMANDPLPLPGATEWRAAFVARDLAAALEGVLAQFAFDVRAPAPFEVPERHDPDPQRRAALMAEVNRVLAEMRAIQGKLAVEAESAAQEVASLQARFDELTEQIKDRMG